MADVAHKLKLLKDLIGNAQDDGLDLLTWLQSMFTELNPLDPMVLPHPQPHDSITTTNTPSHPISTTMNPHFQNPKLTHSPKISPISHIHHPKPWLMTNTHFLNPLSPHQNINVPTLSKAKPS